MTRGAVVSARSGCRPQRARGAGPGTAESGESAHAAIAAHALAAFGAILLMAPARAPVGPVAMHLAAGHRLERMPTDDGACYRSWHTADWRGPVHPFARVGSSDGASARDVVGIFLIPKRVTVRYGSSRLRSSETLPEFRWMRAGRATNTWRGTPSLWSRQATSDARRVGHIAFHG